MHPDQYAYTVMPTVFAREDKTWIQEQLTRLPVGMRGKIASAYGLAYQEAFDAEPVEFRQENAARRTANKRLREFCKRYSPAVQGFTVPPPTRSLFGSSDG